MLAPSARIRTRKGWVNVMWDSGASLSFITNSKAKEENLRGNKLELSILKVGCKVEKINRLPEVPVRPN